MFRPFCTRVPSLLLAITLFVCAHYVCINRTAGRRCIGQPTRPPCRLPHCYWRRVLTSPWRARYSVCNKKFVGGDGGPVVHFGCLAVGSPCTTHAPVYACVHYNCCNTDIPMIVHATRLHSTSMQKGSTALEATRDPAIIEAFAAHARKKNPSSSPLKPAATTTVPKVAAPMTEVMYI